MHNLSILYLAIDITSDLIVNVIPSALALSQSIETFLVVSSDNFVDYPRLSSELVRSSSEFSDILALWEENLAHLVEK